jgi:hypothetical protein
MSGGAWDYSYCRFPDAIKAFLEGGVDREVLAVLTEDAKNLIKQLQEYLGQNQIKKEEI